MPDVLVRVPRVLPVPDPNPPYDSVDAVWRRIPPARSHQQGVLALEFMLPSGLPARPVARMTPARSRRDEADRWSRLLAQAFAETIGGTRPPAQLRFWATKYVHRRLLLAIRLAGAAGPRGWTVGAVHLQTPARGTVEVTATLHGSGHAHSMAFRLEARGDQWLCTALDVGFLPRPR